jgi:Protein of unknown function (DUF1573)
VSNLIIGGFASYGIDDQDGMLLNREKDPSMAFFRLVISGIIMAWGATTATASPRLITDQPEYISGTIRQGKMVEHQFVTHNRGNTPLLIRGVKSACGCTAASFTTAVIPAGKSRGTKASFESTNISGAVHKTVAIYTNDPADKSAVLILKGTTIQVIQVEARQMNLGLLKLGATVKSTLVITNRGTVR